jgi:hypothetical protein|tara:strand:- start:198 stop:374 length:177 start_codon:yes stop_codon:yes gene_type:complete
MLIMKKNWINIVAGNGKMGFGGDGDVEKKRFYQNRQVWQLTQKEIFISLTRETTVFAL